MPRISDPPTQPADIWAYATRTLTSHAFPFTNPASPVDLPNVQQAISPTGTGREANLDNLDVAVSSRQAALTIQFEKYADVSINHGVTYTPAVRGIWFMNCIETFAVYHYVVNKWQSLGALERLTIGDGTNFYIRNESGVSPGRASLFRYEFS